MVKNLKRTLALMLSIIMIFSYNVSAFAGDEGIIGSNEAGTSAQVEETVAAEAETQAEVPTAEATTQEKQVEAATETVDTVAAEITAQPEDASVFANAEAEFALETNSKVKSCQWQIAKTKDGVWTNLNRRQYGSSETLKIRALEKYNKWFFRCIVTFRDGSTQVSEEARLNIVEKDTLPAQTFGSIKDTKVVAPEGAFPAGTTMEANEVDDTKAVQSIIDDMKGVDGSVLNAVDITFYDGNAEIQPQETVKVTMNVGKDVDFDNLTLVHIKANADELDKDGIKTEKVDFTANKEAGTITFAADHFSTYALAIGSGESTIIWGYMDGNNFVEFKEDSTTMDTTASSLSLENSFDGYYYRDAVYCANGKTMDDGIDITPTLNKVNGNWTCNAITTDEQSGESTTVSTPIENGSKIYVVYYKPTPEQQKPSGTADESVPSPETTKTVTHNDDGTYKVRLDIAGTSVEEDHSHYVNVLVVLDATTSMSGAKWTNAKNAMDTLVSTLTTGENAGNANHIDFSLVTFGRAATVQTTDGAVWTKDNAAFRSTCSGIRMVTTSGTNWESGMRGGLYGALDQLPASDNDPTYCIFLTDGDPNTWYDRNNCDDEHGGKNYDDTGTRPGYQGSSSTAATRAGDEAAKIAAKTKLYGIFCGTSTDTQNDSYRRLNGIITGNGGVKTIAADASTIESEFLTIAQTILDEMGANNVSVDDGVPSLSSISSNVQGEPSGYDYYISTDGGKTFNTWNDAPGATYSNDNGVTWDLQKTGTLKEGTVYRIEFNVWPSQEALDTIADLNNKKITMTDAELAAAGIGKNSDGTYTLLTNTHLNTTYTFKDVEYSDPTGYTSDNMPLPTRTIKAHKVWQNELDGRTAAPVQLIVTKDDKPYLANADTTVSSETNWYTKDIHVSMGFMSITDNKVTIREPGHDYAIIEPENLAYYWELHSDVYHPMVINGTPTMLILDETATTADNTNTFEINGKIYKKSENTDNVIEATNKRRSNLNITKTVTGTNPPADSYFTYKVNVKDADGENVWFSVFENPNADEPLKEGVVVTGATAEDGNTGYYYAPSQTDITIKIKAGWNIRFINLRTSTTYTVEETAMDPGFEFVNARATVEGDKDATPATVDDKKATGTIDKPNTKYIVTYTNKFLGCFYVYHSANNTVERHFLTDADVKEETDGTYTFDIYKQRLTDYLYGGYYYDYMGKSNGFDATKAAALDYSGEALPKDADGKAYTYQYIADNKKAVWKEADAGTVDGRQMKVEQDGVYYIKEVPTSYLLPYNHYTYYKEGLELANLWTITAIDDLNYKKAGFIVQTDDNEAVVVNTMTIRAKNSTVKTTLNAGKVFQRKGVLDGYLGYYEITSYKPNKTTIVQYWDTPDGIREYGKKMRTLTFEDKTISGLRSADTDYTPSGN